MKNNKNKKKSNGFVEAFNSAFPLIMIYLIGMMAIAMSLSIMFHFFIIGFDDIGIIYNIYPIYFKLLPILLVFLLILVISFFACDEDSVTNFSTFIYKVLVIFAAASCIIVSNLMFKFDTISINKEDIYCALYDQVQEARKSTLPFIRNKEMDVILSAYSDEIKNNTKNYPLPEDYLKTVVDKYCNSTVKFNNIHSISNDIYVDLKNKVEEVDGGEFKEFLKQYPCYNKQYFKQKIYEKYYKE